MAEGCLAFQPTNLMETSQFTLHISCQNSFSASPLHARPVAPLALAHTSYSWILFREKKKSLLAFLKPQTSDDGIVCLKRTAKFAVQIIIFTGWTWTLLTLRVFLSKKSLVIANKQLNLSPILSIKMRGKNSHSQSYISPQRGPALSMYSHLSNKRGAHAYQF